MMALKRSHNLLGENLLFFSEENFDYIKVTPYQIGFHTVGTGGSHFS
jgi:hypothetical protein